MYSNEFQRIVILGGGTAGWATAAALSKLLPASHFSITLVESDQIGTVGVGEATFPSIKDFNRRLGIDEVEFMKATNATFKVGIEFCNWAEVGDSYIHPFGRFGDKINGIPLHHFWMKNMRQGSSELLSDYSLGASICNAGKFTRPSNDPSRLDSTFDYAYHLDANLYGQYLRKFSEKLGVKRIEGKVTEVKLTPSDDIKELCLESKEVVTGDFFVDCSGFKAQLISQALRSDFEDWTHWLPCNRAVAIASERVNNIVPYTKSIAREAGWQWQIPLQSRVGNGYVFCNDYIDETKALDTLLGNLPGAPISEPKFLSFKTGKRKKSWFNNCLAIGLSSNFLEPLESTSIYLIQRSIIKLVELLPQKKNMHIKAREYNESFDVEVNRIKDFLILHYHATNRTDTPFWNRCRTMEIPDTLKHRMEMFKETGHIQQYKLGAFFESSWTAVYFGQKFYPRRYDSRIELMEPQVYLPKMEMLKTNIKSTVSEMPSHIDFLENFDCVSTRQS